MLSRCLVTTLALVGFCAFPVTGQPNPPLAPGDLVRFEFTQNLEARAADGTLVDTETVRVRREGTVISLADDTLVVEDDGVQSRLATARIDELLVRRSLEESSLRGFRRGALLGGIAVGGMGAALALCNPAVFGDDGCTGADGAGMVVEFALVGAGIGALTGGLLGALLAPRSEWASVRLDAGPTADGAVGMALRVPVGT